MDSGKRIYSFEIKKEYIIWVFIRQFFYQFFNRFLVLLLYRIYV